MATQSNGRVVLVTPDRVLADVTAFRLNLLGFQPIVYDDADAALAGLEHDSAGLLMVDLRLEDGQAWRLLDAVSRNETTAALPVLVLSTDAELDTVQKAFRAGARDFLVLPYDPLALDRKVEQLVAEWEAVGT
ncbi:MAG: hypothetical protein KatS3mg110_0770 [Pirellulaceae bacterium]|nr:MAG: hypothetical protein KatS3mg110_0770 [Pirellulaceae bacterium]